MAKKLKRVNANIDIQNYGQGDPFLDLLRNYFKDDLKKWKEIVENDQKCLREQRQKEINYKRRYKL